ncbi:adenylate/guanylate cyclase domain-containing protein [Denitratisoma oestradiolicum]|nr:adenylate/guanylate cyclase domain-containing protein [Denitratisoma oestradiolicum]
MLSSKEILDSTGISRATLNNYIAMGLVSKPVVMNPGAAKGPRQLGFFPENTVERVRHIQKLKQEGISMANIVSQLKSGITLNESRAGIGEAHPLISSSSIKVTLDDLPHPAYMLNPNFELTWLNEHARTQLFGGLSSLPATSEERGLFRLLSTRDCWDIWQDLLDFHLGLAKGRLSPTGLGQLCHGIPAELSNQLQQRLKQVNEISVRPVAETSISLADAMGMYQHYKAYASFFREGIFIAYVPDHSLHEQHNSLLDLLARRDEVIRGLLQRRLPVLTPLAVLVADLQSSVKICSELPPEEYFELINEIWTAMGPIFRKYHASCGKHVGDGLVYYFFPQPDSDYLANSIACAQEISHEMQKLSKAWQLRKNWLNELYLNIGITEGQEWLGTFQTSTSVEFVVLGDTINQAARISDLARHGAIWATKSLIGKLSGDDRQKIRYGVRRRSPDGRDMFVPASFCMVSSLLEQDGTRADKLNDIATLAITEIVKTPL